MRYIKSSGPEVIELETGRRIGIWAEGAIDALPGETWRIYAKRLGGLGPLMTSECLGSHRLARPPGQADLALSLGRLPARTSVGGAIRYAIAIRNKGPDPAYDLAVRVTTSVAVRYSPVASSIPTTCTLAHSPGESGSGCTLNMLPAGSSWTLRISVRPVRRGTLTARASVTSVTADVNPSNNSARRTARVR